MSKSDKAKLNMAFFGVLFLMAVTSKFEFSQLLWIDRFFAVVGAVFSVGWAIRWLYISWKEPA